jgi:hypothetical protein
MLIDPVPRPSQNPGELVIRRQTASLARVQQFGHVPRIPALEPIYGHTTRRQPYTVTRRGESRQFLDIHRTALLITAHLDECFCQYADFLCGRKLVLIVLTLDRSQR